jgi:hypothetical protein
MPLLCRVSKGPPPTRGTTISFLLLAVAVATSFSWNGDSPRLANAFSVVVIPGSPFRLSTTERKTKLPYGRNMEIWPPVGLNDVIQIKDSFPNGILAPSASPDTTAPENLGIMQIIHSWWQRKVCTPRSALDDASKSSISFLWISVGIWILTLQTGAVRPIDLLTISALSGYFCLWQRHWTRSSSTAPLDRGQTPYTVRFPLGYQMTHSLFVRNWKLIGCALGQVMPFLVLLILWTTRTTAEAIFVRYSFYSWMIRVLFFSSSQAIIEHLSESTRTGVRSIPLPIRGFIPVAYSSVRLLYLWQWMRTICQPDAFPFSQSAVASAVVRTFFRALPLVHVVYGLAHLLGFLIPVVLVRYMRVYFYMVEAQEVQLRTAANTLY